MAPSLQKFSGDLFPIAVANYPTVKEYIFSSPTSPLESSSKFGEWKVPLENIISKIIEKFPPRLMDIVPKSFSLVALQMFKWADFYNSYFGLSFEFCHNFINCSFFTSKGTIDEEKIAKVLVKNNNLETFVQYKIACYYFMEETIIILWNQLRESADFKEQINKYDSGEPFVMWSEYLEEKSKLSTPRELECLHDSFVTLAFHYGLTNKNVAAVKYYWSSDMLSKNRFGETQEEINEIELRNNYKIWPSVFFRDCNLSPSELLLSKDFGEHRNILLFFLSHLNRMELDKYLQVQKLTNIFKYLIFWPYQNFIFDKFESRVEDLKNCDHALMIHTIVDMIQDSNFSQTYDYRNLLKKYLINRPVNPRNHLLAIEAFRTANCFFIPTVPILRNLLALLNFTPEDEQIIDLISEFEHLHSHEMYFIKHEEDGRSSYIISLKNLKLDREFLNSHNVWEIPNHLY